MTLVLLSRERMIDVVEMELKKAWYSLVIMFLTVFVVLHEFLHSVER